MVWLNMLVYGPLLIMGEPTGENVNCCWNGPAEDSMGSLLVLLSKLNVSME